ncbi:MAG: hypothetical protein ACRD9S_02310 [Pyrinomonadaceae bacterium]
MKILSCVFTLTFLTVGALSCVSAQTRVTDVSGEWVGNIEAGGKSQFISVSVRENAGAMTMPLDGFSTQLTSISIQNQQVVFQFNQVKLVLKGTIADDEIQGGAIVPGTIGVFHLTRTRRLGADQLKPFKGRVSLSRRPFCRC